jgi:hypothetical protein
MEMKDEVCQHRAGGPEEARVWSKPMQGLGGLLEVEDQEKDSQLYISRGFQRVRELLEGEGRACWKLGLVSKGNI